MDLLQLLRDLFLDYTLRTVALGSASLGLVSGALGAFAVLRKQSLMGDAMSHAALPGVVLAFLLTRSREPAVLLLGALAAGWLGTLALTGLVRATRLKEDAVLGLVLSVFFGLGLMLLTYVQHHLPKATQAGLDKYLFGQAATLLERDVALMSVLGAGALLLVAAFWKEFKLLSFDPDFAVSLGLPVRRLDVLLTTLLVVAVVVGLQTVGVVLMSAMVVAPAVAARQWTDRLAVMVGLSAAFGALAGVAGTLISGAAAGLATGPTIVLCISAVVLFSLLFAPNRGLLWGWARHQRNRRRLRLQAVLADLYVLAEQHPGQPHGHSAEVLRAMSRYAGGVQRSLRELQARQWAAELGPDRWVLTPAGLEAARRQQQTETSPGEMA